MGQWWCCSGRPALVKTDSAHQKQNTSNIGLCWMATAGLLGRFGRLGPLKTASKFTMAGEEGRVATSIRTKLTERFKPEHLEVINESYMHNVPKGSETHFKVVVVSPEFNEVKPIARHRLVNSCLEEELQSGVHALSIQASSPQQWSGVVNKSPACKGGFGK